MLTVENLTVTLPSGTQAVRGISLTVAPGETLCLVGESGCGKSLTALALMDLLPPGLHRAGRLHFEDTDLAALSPRAMNRLRGNRMAMIFQEPMTSLNPAFTIGEQLVDVFTAHRPGGRPAARARAEHLLQKVGIAAPAARMRQHPHELSGGLRQRVMIAMALMCGPSLMLADEPTTALDVTVQAELLRLLADLRHELGMAMILISHDLALVSRVADRIAVMYAGQIIETGPAAEVLNTPQHPYTKGLLACLLTPGRLPPMARMPAIPGRVPTLAELDQGCSFRPRCPQARPECAAQIPLQDATEHHAHRCILKPENLPPSLPGRGRGWVAAAPHQPK